MSQEGHEEFEHSYEGGSGGEGSTGSAADCRGSGCSPGLWERLDQGVRVEELRAFSRQVKAQLAEKAEQAAKAAEAALTGKQAMVEQLEHEVREAEAVVQEESASFQQTQNNLQVAVNAACQAGHLVCGIH